MPVKAFPASSLMISKYPALLKQLSLAALFQPVHNTHQGFAVNLWLIFVKQTGTE